MLADARASIDAAVKANPDLAYAHAIRALVYDWSASAVAASRAATPTASKAGTSTR